MIKKFLVRSPKDLERALDRSVQRPEVPIGIVLLAARLIERGHLEEALEQQGRQPDKHLGCILVDAGRLDPEWLHAALAFKFGIPYVRLDYLEIDPAVLSLLAEDLAVRHTVMPLAEIGGALVVAMDNPFNADVVALIRFNTGRDITVTLSSAREITLAHSRYYSRVDEHEALETVDPDPAAKSGAQRPASLLIEREARKEPIVRLLNAILLQGVVHGASDINLRPGREHLNIYYRIDGRLQHSRTLHRSLHAPLVSRAKIIGGMDIAERRMPQEGNARLLRGKKGIDLRLSVIPTVNGESLVIRILDPDVGIKPFAGLGLGSDQSDRVRNILRRPYGLFLVTGPTGSGKTTTLYALLNEVRKSGAHILSVEDPVEYNMEHVEQVQIVDKIGLTFAEVLRRFLRHDPDVIMVGEIRDAHTASIAIRAALTGHFVMSTLHTNDAPSTLARLVDMGLEPYLLASTVLGVMAQRLVRLNCPHCTCRQTAHALTRGASASVAGIALDPDEVFGRGAGCPACHFTGYAGRRLIAEVLPVTPQIAELIGKRATPAALRACAREQGMTSLGENAWRLARAGRISLEEALAVVAG